MDVPAPLVSRPEVADDVLALTFDDGPSEWTDAILDALEAAGARATFFVIGGAIDGAGPGSGHAAAHRSGRVRARQPHVHAPGRARSPRPRFATSSSGRPPRSNASPACGPSTGGPPYLRSDDRARRVAHELGLREVGCSIATTDYEFARRRDGEPGLARAGRGDIVDLHDGRPATDAPADSSPTREDTVHAVRVIVAELARSACAR